MVEDSVVYRSDLTDGEWSELRRRQAEEARMLDEMFGLALEARAEGLVAIDPSGSVSDLRFPSTGTLGHCALLVLERLDALTAMSDMVTLVRELAAEHSSHWSKDFASAPDRLAHDVVALLAAHRLIETSDDTVRVLPAAHRFAPTVTFVASEQGALW